LSRCFSARAISFCRFLKVVCDLVAIGCLPFSLVLVFMERD
jgi:hypothetical protein